MPECLPVPAVSADLTSGIFTAPENAEFSADGGTTWEKVPAKISSDLLGKAVPFRLPADSRNFASETVMLTAHPSRWSHSGH